jgi:hypothetical protein
MFCITVNATLSGGLGPVCRASEDETRQTRAFLCVCGYVQPGGQGSVVTSGDEAVAWRACHQQQVDGHGLGYVVRADN